MKKSKNIDDLFPIYKIENDCILSKQGDFTIAFSLELPEIFTLSISDFELMHLAWIKAIRLLPKHTVLHKQDWFTENKYAADFSNCDHSFLSHCSERFFNERPYLDHHCYLFLTKKPQGRKLSNSLFSNLVRPSLVPFETLHQKTIAQFEDTTGQFCKILQDSGYLQLIRLTSDQLASTQHKPGLIERYCHLLNADELPLVKDISLGEDLKVGNNHCQIFTLADPEDLPSICGPTLHYDKYSTDKTKFNIGFASPLGQMLSCNHVYNQYIIIDDAQLTIKKLESKRLRLQSLSAYSRENAINREATNQFLNEA